MNFKLAFLISIVFHTAIIFGIPSSLLWRSSRSEIVKNGEPIAVQIVYRRADIVTDSEGKKSYNKREIPVSGNILQPEKTRKIMEAEAENSAPDVLPAQKEMEDKKHDIEPAMKPDDALHNGGRDYSAAVDDISLPTGNAGNSDTIGARHDRAAPMESESETNDGAGECDRALAVMFEHAFGKEIVVQELRRDRSIGKRRGAISLRLTHGSAEIGAVEKSGNALMDEIALSAAGDVVNQVSAIAECKGMKRTVTIPYLFRWKENHE
ncbi:MAG: hypothetical protein AB1546_08000 [bacterium]